MIVVVQYLHRLRSNNLHYKKPLLKQINFYQNQIIGIKLMGSQILNVAMNDFHLIVVTSIFILKYSNCINVTYVHLFKENNDLFILHFIK